MQAPLGITAFARRARLSAFALALTALGYGALPAPPVHAEDVIDVYSWDVELAPVCIDGNFEDFDLKVGSQTKHPELHVGTDVRGHLKGTLIFDGLGLNVSGTVARVEGAVHVEFKARSFGNKITFKGDVPDGVKTLSGTWTGKGNYADGTGTFTVDLSKAGPLVATVECAIQHVARGRIKGTAHVLACEQDIPLTVSGKWDATAVNLTLKQKSFKFKGHGVGTGTDADLDWTIKGFGASTSGTGLHLSRIDPPVELEYPQIAPEYETDLPMPTIVPISGNAPHGAITVSPPLPAGIVLDPDDGRISGTPTAVVDPQQYTITAKNYAGSSSAILAFGTRIQRARSFAPELRSLTDADYKHFLARAEFGVRQIGGGQTTLNLVRNNLNGYIDSMLVFSMSGPAESIAAPELGNPNFPSSTQLSRWWSSLMMNSTNPFQERLAFFWADRFAVSAESLEVGEAHFMKEYIDLFRSQGNGNLRSLLLSMSRSGAMLKYLNGNVNTLDAPNENFAREFWELFTLGVGNGYTQADIVQASRAWTGWKFVTNPSTGSVSAVFDPALHDATDKQPILGQVVAGQNATDDFQTMVNLTVDNRPVAEFITTKLFEHFAFENPHPTLVAAMADNLRQNNYQLAPFLKALFKSEAFFSNTARNALAKSPLDFSVGFIHATGLKITPTSFQTLLTTLGQPPAIPPSVNGFPQGDLWFSAQNMADRVNLLDACVNDTTRQASVGINAANILPPPGSRSAAQVVDAMASLFNLTLVSDERQTLIGYVGSLDGVTQAVIDDKLRGLLAILAQHPTYQLR